MHTCEPSNMNWLEKSPMNFPRQQSNNGSFNSFISKHDTNEFQTSALNRHNISNPQSSQKLAQNIYSHGQIIHDNPYLHQSHQQSVANLITGFDHPAINNDLTINNSDSSHSHSTNGSLTALQQMLTSPNTSFFNSMQSHQSQVHFFR